MGGYGGRRKVWEGSQKSVGGEKTVGGLRNWLLMAVETGGLVSPRTRFVRTSSVGLTTAMVVATVTSSETSTSGLNRSAAASGVVLLLTLTDVTADELAFRGSH